MALKKWDEVTKLSLMAFFLHLYFLTPVAVFFFQQRGLNFFEILALESILVLFIFFFEVPTGIVGDMFGRKKSIAIGALLFIPGPIIFLFARSFLLFAIAFALGGIALSFLSGTVEALIYDHLKSSRKQHLMKKAMGKYGSATQLGRVVAPIIGSYLARNLLNSQFLLLIYFTIAANCIGFIVSLLLKDTNPHTIERESPIALLKEGVSLLRQNGLLQRIILLSTFSSPFLYVLTLLYQPYLKSAGASVVLLGPILAIGLLLSALLQRYAYKFEELVGMKKAVFLATLLPGVFYIAMVFVVHPLWSMVLFVLIMMSMGLKDPLFSGYKNLHIPSKGRATALSLISMISVAYQVVMRLVIGKLADYSLSSAFAFMGFLIIAASLLLRIDESSLTPS